MQGHGILAIALNPALDITYSVERLRAGQVHRVADVQRRAGGKAVNVARVLDLLGETVTLTGLVGGETGAVVGRMLRATAVAEAMVRIAGDTRSTVTVVDGEGDATGLWEPGPEVSKREWDQLCARVGSLAGDHCVVVVSGSVPAGVPRDGYRRLTEIVHAAGRPVIVDADDDVLRLCLDAAPDIVTPNREELARAAGAPGAAQPSGGGDTSDAWARVVEQAESLRRAGAGSTVATCGPDGLLAATPDGIFRARPPERVTGNATGAGDAVVAALARGLARGHRWETTLADAVALAAATVLCSTAGAFSAEHYDRWRSVSGAPEVIAS